MTFAADWRTLANTIAGVGADLIVGSKLRVNPANAATSGSAMVGRYQCEPSKRHWKARQPVQLG